MRLDGLDPVTRARLRDGNWLVEPAAGAYFKRAWFKIVGAVAAEGVLSRWRAWDRAATVPHEGRPQPQGRHRALRRVSTGSCLRRPRAHASEHGASGAEALPGRVDRELTAAHVALEAELSTRS
jgi:hypothetical protein